MLSLFCNILEKGAGHEHRVSSPPLKLALYGEAPVGLLF
jgi:hypothetical protein